MYMYMYMYMSCAQVARHAVAEELDKFLAAEPVSVTSSTWYTIVLLYRIGEGVVGRNGEANKGRQGRESVCE